MPAIVENCIAARQISGKLKQVPGFVVSSRILNMLAIILNENKTIILTKVQQCLGALKLKRLDIIQISLMIY